MRLGFLSSNLVLILQEIVKNQNICKLLHYNTSTPLSSADITLPANNLILNKIFPYPFNQNVILEDCSQIRVYVPNGYLENNRIIENTDICFDIIVAKNLWLINNNGQSLIRSYEIAKELVNIFNKNVSTIGRLNFKKFIHISVNDKFDCIRLISEMMTLRK